MHFAILMHDGGKTYAILKTEHDSTAIALSSLIAKHQDRLMPGTAFDLSADRALNAETPMHPDKDFIINRFRNAEFPLPKDPITIDA